MFDEFGAIIIVLKRLLVIVGSEELKFAALGSTSTFI